MRHYRWLPDERLFSGIRIVTVGDRVVVKTGLSQWDATAVRDFAVAPTTAEAAFPEAP
nr:hypothetical protein [Paraburkholderia sp. BL8N3]